MTTADSFAFCEPSTAGAMSRMHIRRVGIEGLLPGGGVPVPALCGRDLRGGWDLPHPFSVEAAANLASPRSGDGHVWLCPRCHEALNTDGAR